MLIGLTGKARSGKSVSAAFLQQWGFQEISFAAPIRSFICSLLNIDLQQLEVIKEVPQALLGGHTPRYAMQTLGTEWGRNMIYHNLWVDTCLANTNPAINYVISDVRFENEARAIRGVGGTIVHIIRPGQEAISLSSHASEQGITKEPQDKVILNSGTMSDLVDSVKQLL